MPNAETPTAVTLSTAADEELIAVVASRQTTANDALHELYNRYAARLLGFLYTRCRSHADADDLAQKVWIKVYESATKFKEGQFRKWLFTIARNEAIDAIRRRRVRAEVGLLDGDGVLLDEALEENERLTAMRDCLQQIDGDFVAAIT